MEKGIEEKIQDYISAYTTDARKIMSFATALINDYPEMSNTTEIRRLQKVEPILSIKDSFDWRHIIVKQYSIQVGDDFGFGYAAYDRVSDTLYISV